MGSSLLHLTTFRQDACNSTKGEERLGPEIQSQQREDSIFDGPDH
jgi:hypothetical protein